MSKNIVFLLFVICQCVPKTTINNVIYMKDYLPQIKNFLIILYQQDLEKLKCHKNQINKQYTKHTMLRSALWGSKKFLK